MTIRFETARQTARTTLTAAAAILGAVLATEVAAQDIASDEAVRQGFHFSVGAGSASVGATCASCTNNFLEDRASGFSGMLRLGGAVTPRLVVGVEGTGWISNTPELDRRVAAASVVLLGYPSATSGLHLKSGVGALRAVVENDLGWIQSDAIVSQIGLGIDFALSDGVALTAYVNYLRTFGTSTWADGVVRLEAINPNLIQFGTALTVN